MSREGGPMPRLRQARKFNERILACPQCRRRFRRLRDLNAHLLRRHEAHYAVELPTTPTGVARPRARGNGRAKT